MLADQREWNGHKQHEIYMANASPSLRVPNATYIPPARVGGWRWELVLGVTQILAFVLGVTQILASLDTKMIVSPTRLGSKPTPVLKSNVFAPQWNIGLMIIMSTLNCPHFICQI